MSPERRRGAWHESAPFFVPLQVGFLPTSMPFVSLTPKHRRPEELDFDGMVTVHFDVACR